MFISIRHEHRPNKRECQLTKKQTGSVSFPHNDSCASNSTNTHTNKTAELKNMWAKQRQTLTSNSTNTHTNKTAESKNMWAKQRQTLTPASQLAQARLCFASKSVSYQPVYNKLCMSQRSVVFSFFQWNHSHFSYNHQSKSPQIFRKSRSHLKIPGARQVTTSKPHTVCQQTLRRHRTNSNRPSYLAPSVCAPLH